MAPLYKKACKDSPYLEMVRAIIGRTAEGGMVVHHEHNLKVTSEMMMPACDTEEEDMGVDYKSIFTAFLVVLIGVITSLAYALFESIRHRKLLGIKRKLLKYK